MSPKLSFVLHTAENVGSSLLEYGQEDTVEGSNARRNESDSNNLRSKLIEITVEIVDPSSSSSTSTSTQLRLFPSTSVRATRARIAKSPLLNNLKGRGGATTTTKLSRAEGWKLVAVLRRDDNNSTSSSLEPDAAMDTVLVAAAAAAENDDDAAALREEMMDDGKELSWYGLGNGDTIQVIKDG
jgi:hypothetical protein